MLSFTERRCFWMELKRLKGNLLRFVGFITHFTGVLPFATESKWCRRIKIGRMSDVCKLHGVDHLDVVFLPPVSHRGQKNKDNDLGSGICSREPYCNNLWRLMTQSNDNRSSGLPEKEWKIKTCVYILVTVYYFWNTYKFFLQANTFESPVLFCKPTGNCRQVIKEKSEFINR